MKTKLRVWKPFEYASTAFEAQERHDQYYHAANGGGDSWETCPTIACVEARRLMGTVPCPQCGGKGRVLAAQSMEKGI